MKHKEPFKKGPYITLEGFTRYLIYPDHTIIDSVTNRPITISRHLNFIMIPDEVILDEKGKCLNIQTENMRTLYKNLSEENIEGFRPLPDRIIPVNYFGDLIAATTYTPTEVEKKSKKIFLLREDLKLKTKAMADFIAENGLEAAKEVCDEFLGADAALKLYKENNPLWHTWREFLPNTDPKELAELRKERDELIQAIYEIDKRTLELRKKMPLMALGIVSPQSRGACIVV